MFGFGWYELNVMGAAIGVWLLITLVSAAVLRWLWNMTMPSVFGLKEITSWQALRLMIISGLLFGGSFGVGDLVSQSLSAPHQSVAK